MQVQVHFKGTFITESPVPQCFARFGIEHVRIRRAEDTAIWPRSTKGFFGLKELIPDLGRELEFGVLDLAQDSRLALGIIGPQRIDR
jgi:hypothetical protein